MKDFKSLCTPAKIYFAIAVIGSVIALFHHVPILAVFVKLVFAFIWTFVLSFLCDKGFKMVSWFLVLLPYAIILLGALGIMHVSQYNRMLRVTQM
jgi:hypothetical protein